MRAEEKFVLLPFRIRSNFWFFLLVLILLSPYIYCLYFCYPRGDDFDEATRAMFLFDIFGGLYEIAREWLHWSGRYTYHFLAVFLGKAAIYRLTYALVCGSVVLLHGIGFYIIAKSIKIEKRNAIFFALVSCLALLVCHQNLNTYYMITDTLTMGLQGAFVLLFLSLMCLFYKKPYDKKLYKKILITGILGIGVYEHSACAIVTISFCALILVNKNVRKKFLNLFIFLFIAICFSFFAPGNFARKSIRHVELSQQIDQLSQIFSKLLGIIQQFFISPWPIVVICLVIIAICFQRNIYQKSNIKLAILSLISWFIISLTLLIIHSLSDVPLIIGDKLSAGLCLYLAYSLGFSLYVLFLNIFKLRIKQMVFAFTTLFLCIYINIFGSFPIILENIVTGKVLTVSEKLNKRYTLLKEIGDNAKPSNAKFKFGLLGEILNKDVRKRKIDKTLPQIIVKKVNDIVYPIYMGETLPENPEDWPNLWVAHLYGLGSISSKEIDEDYIDITK